MPHAISTTPRVDYEHPAYVRLNPTWTLITDCLSGERTIKEKRETYLPKPNKSDQSAENDFRYDQYVLRAVFYNNTLATLTGLVGQVFSKPAILTVDNLLESVTNDMDGAGINIDQSAKFILSEVLANGRAGILVDYPQIEGVATRQDQADGSVRANILVYNAKSIINWRTERVGAENKLSLVVIVEFQDIADDGFEIESALRFRVLRLENGIYKVEVWQRKLIDNRIGQGALIPSGASFELLEEFVPVDGSGNVLTEIPFTFVGSENNDPEPDLPPMYDLAVINIAHYRNSADYEEAVYMVGQPTPYFTGLTEAWVTEVLNDAVYLGSRAAVMLPEGATAGLLQASPNTMPKEAMDAKEKQMLALGAKLIEKGSIERTATEASIEVTSQNSILSTAANNTTDAFTQALGWAALFMGSNADTSYILSTDFDVFKLTAQDQQTMLTLWQNDVLTWDELRDNLRRASMLLTDNEAARTIVEAETLNDIAPTTFGIPNPEEDGE